MRQLLTFLTILVLGLLVSSLGVALLASPVTASPKISRPRQVVSSPGVVLGGRGGSAGKPLEGAVLDKVSAALSYLMSHGDVFEASIMLSMLDAGNIVDISDSSNSVSSGGTEHGRSDNDTIGVDPGTGDVEDVAEVLVHEFGHQQSAAGAGQTEDPDTTWEPGEEDASEPVCNHAAKHQADA